jgi:uncharacterized HAD superfamily protein
MPLRIGLDFDGVFSNCAKLKDDVAHDIYSRSYDELDGVERVTVRNAAYGDRDYVFADRETDVAMEPMDDVFKYVAQLHEDGHDIQVITSRDGDMLEIAQDWYSQQREQTESDVPELAFTGVGYDSEKLDACRDHGVDVFVDDDLYKLEPVVEHVPHRYHFVGPNAAESDPAVAEPVDTWEDLYQEIDGISN